MKHETHKKALAFKEFSRETLFNLIIDGFIEHISIQDIDNSDVNQHIKKEADSPSKLEIRYEKEKRTFISMLFDPTLDSIYALRRNSLFDYMTGLHLYISTHPNYSYTFGLFKDKIASFDKLIEGWCEFLKAVVADVITLPVIAWQQPLILEIEGIVRLYLKDEGIIKIFINMSNFNQLFRKLSNNYNFGIFLSSNNGREEQLFILSHSNGKGEDSGLYKEFTRLNELVIKIKRKQYYYIKTVHEHEFA